MGRGLGILPISVTLANHCLLVRAQSYAERLRLGLAVIHGEAQCTELDMDDGRHSPPMVKNATVHPGLELPCKICSAFTYKQKTILNGRNG